MTVSSTTLMWGSSALDLVLRLKSFNNKKTTNLVYCTATRMSPIHNPMLPNADEDVVRQEPMKGMQSSPDSLENPLLTSHKMKCSLPYQSNPVNMN